ncbi:hypothetical protein GGG16DRAFT_90887 [Schizophyllum commune]
MSSSPTKRVSRAAASSRAFTKREPLRDIAQRADLRSDQNSPTKKRRTARAPPAQLAERIKARHAAAAPSSLPPSSPPDYSSSQENQKPQRPRDETPDVDVKAELRKDFASGGPDEEEGMQENDPPARNSDPFGFFEVEQQLKAERAAGRADKPRAQVPQRVPVRPTPVRRSPPPRPHRRHVLPADSSFEVDESLEVPAIFSSPSPLKRGKRLVATDYESDDDAEAAAALLTEGLDVVEGEHLRAPLHLKSDAAAEEEEEEEEHGEEMQEEDAEGEEDEEAPAPPARATRARASRTQSAPAAKATRRSTRKRAKEEVSDEEDEDEPPKKRATRRATTQKSTKSKKPASRTRSARTTKAEKEESDGEDFGFNSTKKKLEAERKARVAYWKEMADYSMEKEDVYVV